MTGLVMYLSELGKRALAALAGASDKVPTDRPLDGVDASKFLLGESKTTGRRGPPVLRARWFADVGQVAQHKNMDSVQFEFMLPFVGEYQKSVAQYPNIKPGEEFAGYKKPLQKSA
jgi:hypothetical protein